MAVEIMTIISVLSIGVGIFGTLKGMSRNKTADDKSEASEMTTLIVKLEGIQKDCTEIKNDIKSVKEDTKKNTEQIIRMDESLKSAWKQINTINNKIFNKGIDDGND